MHFLLIHGTGGNPNEAWFPWLKKALMAYDYDVVAPQFPTPIGQNLNNWMKVAEKHYDLFDEDLVVIGRSVGAAFIPTLLEKAPIKKPIKAAFLVAGFCSDLHLPAFKDLVSTFIEKDFNWPLIRSRCEKFFVYNSQDDPLVKPKYGKELADNLGVEMNLFQHQQHFWFSKFPPILQDIRSLV
ncbi:MAG: alpha/beta hydrolase [Candidatus Micrarchaeota archaeon]